MRFVADSDHIRRYCTSVLISPVAQLCDHQLSELDPLRQFTNGYRSGYRIRTTDRSDVDFRRRQ